MNMVEWIKKKVEDSRFNYDDIAEEIGVSRTTIYRWLNNPKLSAARCKKIADVIGVDLTTQFEGLEYLYTDKGVNYKERWESTKKENDILRERLEKYESGNSN